MKCVASDFYPSSYRAMESHREWPSKKSGEKDKKGMLEEGQKNTENDENRTTQECLYPSVQVIWCGMRIPDRNLGSH